MNKNDKTSRRRLRETDHRMAALWGGTLVVVLLTLLGFVGVGQLTPAARALDRTWAAKERLDRFQAALARLESATQAHVATGETVYASRMFEQYRLALADLDFLTAQAEDDAVLGTVTARLRAQFASLRTLSEQAISERRTQGVQGAWRVFFQETQPALAQLTASAGQMAESLDQSLDAQARHTEALQSRGQWLAAGGAGLSALLALAAFVLWRRPPPPPPGSTAAEVERLTVENAILVDETTQLQAAQTALRLSRDAEAGHAAAMRTALARSPLFLWAVDPQGTYTLSEGNVTAINGTAPGAAVGRPEAEVMKDSLLFAEYTQRAMKGETFTVELNCRDRWFEAHYRPLHDAQDAICGVAGLALDVTERRAIDQQTLSEESARQASRLHSEFLASMGHEVRTPMNGIVGMAGLLQQTALSDEQRGMLDVIEHSVNDLLAALNDVLDLSKLENGKVQLATSPVDLREVVEDLLTSHGARAHAKGLELINDFEAGLTARVVGDETRLRQVLGNLLGNAIKFTKRGHVVVRVRPTRATPESLGFRVEIVDTGAGLASEAQAKLFQPFKAEDGAVARKFGGTGLGLALAKQLIDLMGGTIGVTSEPGAGATFWFEVELPLADAVADDAPGAMLDGLRLLVVDDNEISRGILALQLAAKGATIDTAEASGAALTRCLSQANDGAPYDVVILDRYMPGADGLQTARSLRATPSLASIPLVLLSPDALPAGAAAPGLIAAVVTKPVKLALLQRAILAAREQDQPVAPSSAPAPAKPVKPVRLRLLLVEDNAVNQKVATMMVRRLGHHVEVAQHGAEALEKLAASSYDAVLMDCHMPVMDGYETTRRIRDSEQEWSDVRIIAVTANSTSADRQRCREAGMDDFVAKPINLASLTVALANTPVREHVLAAVE